MDPLTVNVPPRKRNRLTRLAAMAALLLLLFLACPLSGSPLSTLLQGSSGAADASILSAEDLSGPQLTALAGTIESLSTQLANSGDGTQSPEQIQTAVMGTLIADAGDDGLLLDPSGTPIMILGTSTPGPSATQTKTATPGPSPTPSKTPTPGPSPTSSDTPTPTDTPTLTPTPTASYTPNASISPTATKTPMTPTPSRTPTPIFMPSATPPTTPTPTGGSVVPPTITPNPCMNMGMLPNGFFDNKMSIQVWNNNPGGTNITWIHFFYWPGPNGLLKKIDLNSVRIWEGELPQPNAWITSFSETPYIPAYSSTNFLVFIFENNAEPSGYSLEIKFDNGCLVPGGG